MAQGEREREEETPDEEESAHSLLASLGRPHPWFGDPVAVADFTKAGFWTPLHCAPDEISTRPPF